LQVAADLILAANLRDHHLRRILGEGFGQHTVALSLRASSDRWLVDADDAGSAMLG
jgi:hypothetical protein